jgi:hypothetical protein
MLIINSSKFAQQFGDLYDWIDDDTVDTLNEYEVNDVDTIDYDALERGEVPVVEVDDEGVEEILVDNLQEPQMQEPIIEEPEVIPEEEIAIEGEDVPDFDSAQDAMDWAIENNRVVKIFYTTKGEKRGRGGKQHLLRERELPKIPGGGVNIYRIVEPHHMYQAGNGNLILVTYDRSVRHIRAFIVDNITDYNFTKNRRSKKPQHFKPRIRVMPKSNKRIDTMENNISDNLTEMQVALQNKGLIKSASIVKNVQDIFNDFKTAQYVGSQGYWIRNRRCWDNCYRQKRTTQPKTPAQEVWTECWEEYNKAINDDKSGWEKYAFVKKAEWDINDPKERDKRCMECGAETSEAELATNSGSCHECYLDRPGVQRSASTEKEWNKLFVSKVSQKVKEGCSTPEAVYATIEEESQKQKDQVLDGSSQLMELADTLHSSGMQDIGDKLASISAEMLKDADFFVSSDVEKEADFYGNVPEGGKARWNPLSRARDWMKDKWTGTGGKSDVVKKLQDVINRANSFLMKLNMPTAAAAGDIQAELEQSSTIIIEAGKKMKVAAPASPLGAPPVAAAPSKSLRRSRDLVGDPRSEVSQQRRERGEAKTNEGRADLAEQGAAQAAEQQQAAAELQNVQQPVGELQNVQQQIAPQPAQPRSAYGDIGREYTSFITDVSKLTKDLFGYASKGDQDVKNYTTRAMPLLQKFINQSGQQRQLPDPSARIEFLRGSLGDLVSGLQGILSSDAQSFDPGLGAENAGQVAPGVPQAQPSAPFGGTPQAAQPNVLNLDNLDSYSLADLKPVKKKIDDRITNLLEQQQRGNKAAAFLSNLEKK